MKKYIGLEIFVLFCFFSMMASEKKFSFANSYAQISSFALGATTELLGLSNKQSVSRVEIGQFSMGWLTTAYGFYKFDIKLAKVGIGCMGMSLLPFIASCKYQVKNPYFQRNDTIYSRSIAVLSFIASVYYLKKTFYQEL